MLKLKNFDIPDNNLGMRKNKKIKTGEQLEINKFPLPTFVCPVSNKSFENYLVHHKKCFYTYCKEGMWVFKK